MRAHVADRQAAYPQCFEAVPLPSPPPSPPSSPPSPPPPPPEDPRGNWTDPVVMLGVPFVSDLVKVRQAGLQGREGGLGKLQAGRAAPAAVRSAAECQEKRAAEPRLALNQAAPVACAPAAAAQSYKDGSQLPAFCNDTATPLGPGGERINRGVKVFR